MKGKRGRPPLSQNVLDIISKEVAKKPDIKRYSLAIQLEKEIREKGYNSPSIETMIKLISKVRNSEPLPEDVKWSLAKSLEHGFSPDATVDLLSMFRWCLAAGLEFTVRHAKWQCYLRNVYRSEAEKLPYKNMPGILYQICDYYANRERASDILNIPLDTTDLDEFLSMAPSWWEWLTAVKVGTAVGKGIFNFPEALSKLGIKESTFSERADWVVLKELDLFDENYAGHLDPQNFDSPIIRIFAHWLRYISKGPNWAGMSKKERQQIAITLRDGLIRELTRVETERTVNDKWEPTEILKSVGLSTLN